MASTMLQLVGYRLVLAYLALLVGPPLRVTAYSTGAPPSSCYTMQPSHLDPDSDMLIPAIRCDTDEEDCSELSLTVTRHGVSDGHYSCNEEHQVTLESEVEFVGYLIQARVPIPGQPFHEHRIVGTIVSPGPGVKTLECNATADSPSAAPQANSATQSQATLARTTVTVTWRAPEPFIAQGNIQFYATVIEDLEHFYLPVISEVLEPLDSTCRSYLPYLSLGTTSGVSTQEVPRLDDWSSDPIPIPGGFPFGTYNHTVVYIGTNGVFSFGYRETGYWHHISQPTRFYAAPFWGDVDLTDGGNITYEIHRTPSLLIDQVSSFVSIREDVPFAATWMLVAFWEDVQEYGSFTPNGNTFQAIVLTDGERSFMVSTFKNQSISWYDSDVRIGYMGDEAYFSFGPQDNNTFLDLIDNSGSVLYYNEIYQLSIDGARLTLVRPALSTVTVSISQNETKVTLQFDLAVAALSCDVTQFSLQSMDKTVTFVPLHHAPCVPFVNFFGYDDGNSADNTIAFTLHPSDHSRLLGSPYNQIIINNLAGVSVGSTFVLTTGLTGVNPTYFSDMITATVYRQNSAQTTVVAFSLDMTLAQFTMQLSTPANISGLNYISLSCGQLESAYVTIYGTQSTPEITQTVLVRLRPFEFANICYNFPCIEQGFAVLESFASFQDPLGNPIISDSYAATTIPVIGAGSCTLGVDGQDPAINNNTLNNPAINNTHSIMPRGPLGLYLKVASPYLNGSETFVLYPLYANEIYLHDCYSYEVVVDSVVCLRLDNRATSPQLTFTSSADATVILWSDTAFSSTAMLQNVSTYGTFLCSSAEGHQVSAVSGEGETYLSTGSSPASIILGSYWNANLTIAMCPSLNPWDVNITNERGFPLAGLTVTNDYQAFHIQAGPLYLGDVTTTNVHIPNTQSQEVYNSVFSIDIEVPPVHVYTAGSTRGSVIVALNGGLLDTSLHCVPENEYISMTWFVYTNSFTIPYPISDFNSSTFTVERNGQVLRIHNLTFTAVEFLDLLFECHMQSSPSTGRTIPIANFTAVGIQDTITISTEQYPLSNGLVSEQFKNNTVLSQSVSAADLILTCYGAAGYGEVRWRSTIAQFAGDLSEDSASTYYSVQYTGSIATVTVYDYGDPDAGLYGSLTCYSDEAGVADEASVTIHIQSSDDICSCGTSSVSPYPLAQCPSASSTSYCTATCPEGYVGDGVLCAVDSDGDGYPDIDTLAFHYCQPVTDDLLCKPDTCPDVYNPDQQLPDVLYSNETGVAFEVNGILLPPSVVIAISNASTLTSIRCLGTEENVDISVELFESQDTNTGSYEFRTDICATEAEIFQDLDADFEGGMRCLAVATGDTAWVYFSTDACTCTTESEPTLPDYVRTCERTGREACACTGTECTCACWHSGDGRVCSVDSDGDGYPDHVASPLCAAGGSQPYCSQDTCPVDYDPDNDPKACAQVQENVCVSEVDPVWKITWSDTCFGYYDTQMCPGSTADGAGGFAFRQCQNDGTWSPVVDTSCCKDVSFETLTEELEEIFEGPITNETASELDNGLNDLVEATTPPDDGTSLFAQDLETTNHILNDAIDFLREGVKESFLEQLSTEVVQVIDNVLEESNSEGWNQLPETEQGAEELLSNCELYGSYIAEAITSPTIPVELDNGELVLKASFNNILITATVQDADSVSDVTFPIKKEEFTVDPVFEGPLAHIRIPAELLEIRASDTNASKLVTVNMVIKNINELLTVNEEVKQINGTNFTTRAVTQLIVSQIVAENEDSSGPNTLKVPVQLIFVTEQILTISTNPRCVYRDFDKGEWSDFGVTTVAVTLAPDSLSYHIVCDTKHLTSFAVLVDVSDVEMTIPEAEAFALTIVTYIGCGISLFCLLLSIIFYLSYGKALFTSVHYFVHLNLAVALFLGYAVFVAGIDYGTRHRIVCGVVAGLLHYLFLSVFCWMLCEGVMLYLMLVVVFSKLSKKWWFFLLLGWGLPVIVVGVSVGLKYEHYGDPEQGFCWISVNEGLIWAFVAPMLAIIVVNVFFLCAALRSLYRVTAGKYKVEDKRELVKKLVLAAFILLPILGVTWAVGLLAVNENTTVFTWLFTVFNSLQGLFFFIFHVIRSDKVWNTIMRCLPGERTDKRGRSLSRKGTDQSSLISKDRTLKKEKKKKNKTVSELPSDTVIVLGNPLAYENPFGTKKDEDLGLASTVMM